VTYYRPIAKLVVIVRRKCRELIRYVHMVTNEELSQVKFNYKICNKNQRIESYNYGVYCKTDAQFFL